MHLKRLAVKTRLEKLGNNPSMERAYSIFRGRHNRSKVSFSQFQGTVAGLIGTNHSNIEIGNAVKLHPKWVRLINNVFEFRDKATVDAIRIHHAGKNTKLENRQDKKDMAERIMDLLKGGKTQSEICAITGADHSTVSRIRREHPELRSQAKQEKIRQETTAKKKRKVSKGDVTNLLKTKIRRNGKIEHAYSFAEIRRRLNNRITVARIAQIAKETAKETGRTDEINMRLGILASHGKLFENTEPYDPKQRKYKPLNGRARRPINAGLAEQRGRMPWLFRSLAPMSPHTSMERVWRQGGDKEQMIEMGFRRKGGMPPERIEQLADYIIEKYANGKPKPTAKENPKPAMKF